MVQLVECEGEGIDRVHDELNLGFLLVAPRRLKLEPIHTEAPIAGSQYERTNTLIGPPQGTAEHFLPILAEPRIPPIVFGGERLHVLVEAGDVPRL